METTDKLFRMKHFIHPFGRATIEFIESDHTKEYEALAAERDGLAWELGKREEAHQKTTQKLHEANERISALMRDAGEVAFFRAKYEEALANNLKMAQDHEAEKRELRTEKGDLRTQVNMYRRGVEELRTEFTKLKGDHGRLVCRAANRAAEDLEEVKKLRLELAGARATERRLLNKIDTHKCAEAMLGSEVEKLRAQLKDLNIKKVLTNQAIRNDLKVIIEAGLCKDATITRLRGYLDIQKEEEKRLSRQLKKATEELERLRKEVE